MEIWLLKMVYLLSASWALESILCLTIEKWSKLLRGAHPRESNFCLTIEFGLTIKICVTAAMSSLLHNGYVPKNVQWTWQFTTRPIRQTENSLNTYWLSRKRALCVTCKKADPTETNVSRASRVKQDSQFHTVDNEKNSKSRIFAKFAK